MASMLFQEQFSYPDILFQSCSKYLGHSPFSKVYLFERQSNRKKETRQGDKQTQKEGEGEKK